MSRWRPVLAILASTSILTATAAADDANFMGTANEDSGSLDMRGMNRTELKRLAEQQPTLSRRGASNASASAAPAVLYEYKVSGMCGEGDEECQSDANGLDVCRAAGEPGPLSRVMRRETTDGAASGGWSMVGRTCFPDDVPGGANRPALTVAMVRAEFAKTKFATPTVTMQPVGNKTLVTLPAYFRAAWPAAGFGPGEINSVTLVGYPVRIRPVFQSNSFTYGDGGSSGTTTSMGGGYPTGDIKHAYTRPGSYRVSASTTYGGEFSVDGGPWMSIPGQVTVAGPTQTLEVVTAKNRLVAR